MIPLTVPEVRRVLLGLAGPPVRRAHRWAWSRFRRRHQAEAQRCHIARRARAHRPTADPPVQTLATAPPDLTDVRWTRIAPLPTPATGAGRPPRDRRTALTGILRVIRRGAAWSGLPADFGPWRTVHRRHRRWRRDGTWDRMPETLRLPDH
ncbi:MAG: transposase [Thermomicrobiales bacterium]